jgi:hypothetical protein
VAVLFEHGVEEVLDALIDGAEVFGEDAVLFAAEFNEVIDEFGEVGGVVGGGAGGEFYRGLAEFTKLEVEVNQKARVAGVGQGGQEGGGVVGFFVHGVW